jgi:2-polyprenyl-6-methoxyphenol hydroxylase-like FAD-dependent oxidoreductase
MRLGSTPASAAEPHIPTPRIEFFGAQGNRLGTVSNGRSMTGAPITLMRRSLHRVLSAEAERRGIAVRRGCAVTGYRQDANGVTIHCADGHEQRADILIGADGIGSKVRAAMPGRRFHQATPG